MQFGRAGTYANKSTLICSTPVGPAVMQLKGHRLTCGQCLAVCDLQPSPVCGLERDHTSPGFEQIWVTVKSTSGGGLEANPKVGYAVLCRSHICAHRRPCSHDLQAGRTNPAKPSLHVIMLLVCTLL